MKIRIRSDWPDSSWLRMICECGRGERKLWAAGSLATALLSAARHQRDDHGMTVKGDIQQDWELLIEAMEVAR